GWLTLYPCGDTPPVVSSLNFAAGATRVSHAIVRLNVDEDFCVFSSIPAHVVVGLMSWYGDSATTGLSPIAPVRPLDSRQTGKHSEYEVDVPDGEAAAITVTITGTSSGGLVWAVPCEGDGLDIPVVAYEANEVVAGATFAPEYSGDICIDVRPNDEAQLPDVIVDVNGVFSVTGPLGFVPTTATRLLDTRGTSSVGGWVGRHGARQTLDIPAAPAGAQAVTGTLTLVRPDLKSWLTAYECGTTLPPSSSVNAGPGLVLANSTTMGVRPADGKLCIFSSGPTNTLFDVVGWWVVLS
ncbi:MAG TPA: SGNH/GDSL hydrolase family protein, partial [Ilumatobacteraceae bacterium]|nr:SGNH/GDSL hydrolase family protein [Ilumatobacteraceae bacterium]